jgi:hypothetical protein
MKVLLGSFGDWNILKSFACYTGFHAIVVSTGTETNSSR